MRQMKEGREDVRTGEELFAARALRTTAIFQRVDDTALKGFLMLVRWTVCISWVDSDEANISVG